MIMVYHHLGHSLKRLPFNRSLIIPLVFIILLVLTIIYYESKLAQLQSLNLNLNFQNVPRLSSSNFDESDHYHDKNSDWMLPKNLLVIYNRVPKTGSTSLMGIVYDLCAQNHFNVGHLNTSKNSHVMSLSDQLRFVWNITRWYERQPLLIHGHVAFINFEKFALNTPKPLYINMIRRPIDRLISYYYFLRYGDNFRPNVVRRRQGNRRTFDECIERNEHDCRMENLWLQIPFFCGQNPDCWKPGNKWALEQAKRNLVEHYFLVGVTEAMHDFIQILEISLPQMFRGATFLYENGNKSHLRKTFNKTQPSSRTIAKIQQSRVWQMENEFYHFALYNFNSIKERIMTNIKPAQQYNDKLYYQDEQQFFFEKIRPR